ncbi:putative nuclease of the RecB family [Thaumarchaeota archaeon SCGC AB-539-E09]|nr:putative nuclease of the RecB family [Thaumarchaeota archaeon SCGC AB-539-E09]
MSLNHEKKEKHLTLNYPSLDEASKQVRLGISRHKTVVLVGNCGVDYDGRASSKLESGERIIIIKPDGSALVHRPRDYSPVNWQPSGSLFRTRISNNHLLIRVFRRKENEVLEMSFDKIIFLALFDLNDHGKFHLYASEKDMQQAILLEPSLLEEGFRPISSEKPVEPGFIDIIGVDSNNILTIVEIKRKAASKEAVMQLKKYVDVYKTGDESKLRGILVAPELAKGAQKTLASLGLEYKALSPQRCAEVLKRKETRALTDYFNDD